MIITGFTQANTSVRAGITGNIQDVFGISNFWLEKARQHKLLRIAPEVAKHFNISTNRFLSCSRPNQDKLVKEYEKAIKKRKK